MHFCTRGIFFSVTLVILTVWLLTKMAGYSSMLSCPVERLYT